jgi:hypothetical protein
MALISLAGLVRIRETAQRAFNGEWDFDAILNREIYPALNQLKRLIIQIVDNVQPTTITPPQITANQNDYTTEGQDKAGRVRISGSADWTITGLSAEDFEEPFSQKTYINVGSFKFFFTNEDVLSAAENRFANQGDLELALLPDDTVTFWYDTASQRVRPL